MIFWSYRSPIAVNPGADGILDALESAGKTGERHDHAESSSHAADHVKGPANAPVTLVEYGDYECPHCGLAHPVVQRLRQRLRSEAALRLSALSAQPGSPECRERRPRAAEFAGAQGQFWEMHDGLYENQDRLRPAALFRPRRRSGSRKRRLREALASGTYAPKVRSRLPGRRAQRRERYTDVLHQRSCATTGRYAFEDLAAAIELHALRQCRRRLSLSLDCAMESDRWSR